VIASAWPRGLLQAHQGKKPTVIAASLAEELCYEVGWQARHAMIDVRTADHFARSRARGAHSVPYEPAVSFLERAEAAVSRLHIARPPAQHLALASQTERDARTLADNEDTPRLIRLVVAGDGDTSLALVATADLLAAGFTNAVALDVGIDDWVRQGRPLELGESEDPDDFPDSTL
jgi:rhodanese-related sulfurtransferase